jgi:hypothetical protein
MGTSKKQGNVRTGARAATCTGEQADGYGTFQNALKKVLAVSHEELKVQIARVASVTRASRAKR